MKKILVILGPTATGKTDLALHLAKKFDGELVAADSRQVYRGLDIGTGKLPSDPTYEVRYTGPRRSTWEIGGIRVWMYDIVNLNKQYTVADYVKDANQVILDITKRNKLPIIVGGTGLYIKALLEGLDNLGIPVDKKLRRELECFSLKDLQRRLKLLSSTRWKNLNQSDRQNPRRLVRAIELATSPRRSYFDFAQYHLRGVNVVYDVLKIGLIAPRAVLYQRSDFRVLDWFNQGIIEEVKNLVNSGISLERIRQLGLEYASLADYLDGGIRGMEGDKGLTKIIQNKVRGYIRRQLTWFNPSASPSATSSGSSDSGQVTWFDITTADFMVKIEKGVHRWYDID